MYACGMLKLRTTQKEFAKLVHATDADVRSENHQAAFVRAVLACDVDVVRSRPQHDKREWTASQMSGNHGGWH